MLCGDCDLSKMKASATWVELYEQNIKINIYLCLGLPLTKMKKIKPLILSSICILLAINLNAQNKNEFETLFKNDWVVSGFGGPAFNFSTIGGEFAFFVGGGGAVLIDDSFFIGGMGMAKTTETRLQYDFGNGREDSEMEIGYGGIWTGYIYNGSKAIHPTFHLLIGWGGVDLQPLNRPDNQLNSEVDPFFTLIPSIELEANIIAFMRAAVGINYRWVSGVDSYEGFSSNSFSGPGIILSLRFGGFGKF